MTATPAPPPTSSKETTVRIGLIGLGRIGAFHARTLTDLPVVEELVVADAVAGLADRVAA